MSERSKFLLGDFVFIKVISLNDERGIRLAKALATNEVLPPFTSNEFLFNYLISRDDKKLNISVDKKYNTLLSPDTKVFVSGKSYSLNDFTKYKKNKYNKVIHDLKNKFSDMEDYLKNIRSLSEEGKIIKTALIISRTVTGNYDDFFKKLREHKNYNKVVLDSLIHIMYLYFTFQNRYQSIHGDPKIQNYTWLELDNPIDIIYDFRDNYDNSDSRLIHRKGVKHLFYLTDLEFVYSPILKTVKIGTDIYYFNFDTTVGVYGEDNNKDRIFVPKMSENLPYFYNLKLYGGYKLKPTSEIFKTLADNEIHDWYGNKFPRMFTIDILILIKMLLTYWYASSFDGEILRKLNIYFTQFISLSLPEKDVNLRNKESYKRLSPGNAAILLDS